MSGEEEALRALSAMFGEADPSDLGLVDDEDPRVWREVGRPLLPPAGRGPLSGMSVAVQDVFEVEGFPLGFGNPAFLASAEPSSRTAPVLQSLLDAGASLRGIAQTDEFGYSIAGANSHYGTPPNGAVTGRLPGGSTSGPASAVALGQADIGLGTDSAGSICVPASYQGLWGLRSTHGAVPREGVGPLAPSFDSVGWLARDPATLRRAAAAALGPDEAPMSRLVVAPSLLEGLPMQVLDAFEDEVVPLQAEVVDIPDPGELQRVLRIVQAAEAWRSHGSWLSAHPEAALGPGVRERFETAAATTLEQEAVARAELAAYRAELDTALGDRVLLLPSAASAAPSVDASPAELDAVRRATLRLCAVAAVAGRPALSVPLLWLVDEDEIPAPLGLCLVGPRDSDLVLIDAGIRLASLRDHS